MVPPLRNTENILNHPSLITPPPPLRPRNLEILVTGMRCYSSSSVTNRIRPQKLSTTVVLFLYKDCQYMSSRRLIKYTGILKNSFQLSPCSSGIGIRRERD